MSIRNKDDIKQIKKDISKVKSLLLSRFKTIKKHNLQEHSPAMTRYKQLDTKIRGKSDQEIKDLYNDLLYIKGLKTSKYMGSEHYKQYQQKMSGLTDVETDKIEKLYEQFYTQLGWEEDLQYEIEDIIYNNIYKDEDTIKRKIMRYLDSKGYVYYGDTDDEEEEEIY